MKRSNHAIFKNKIQEFMKKGEVRDVEMKLLKKDGDTIDVSVSVTAMYDENRNIIKSRAVLRDITQRKMAENALKESEKDLRAQKKELQEKKCCFKRGFITD